MIYISLSNLVKIFNIIEDYDLRVDEVTEYIQDLIDAINDLLKELVQKQINLKTHELIEIYNLMFDDMLNENWEEIGTNEEIKDIILEIFSFDVIDKIQLKPPSAPPEPQRYIDSDEYLFRTKFNKKRFEQMKEDNEIIKLRLQNERLAKEIEELKNTNKELIKKGIENNEITKKIEVRNKNKDLLKDLPIHAKHLLEFHRQTKANSLLSPKESNRQTIESYKEWLELNKQENQQNLVNEIISELEISPLDWYINFEQLTNEGRKLLFPKLKQFLDKLGERINVIEQYKISFNVDGEWHSKTLSPEIWRKLNDDLSNGDLLYEMDTKPPEYFYNENDIPPWSLYNELTFSKLKKYQGYNDRGGTFFKYKTQNVPQIVIDYLKRLQIFDTLTEQIPPMVRRTQRKELNDCCFIYALQQTGEYTEEELNRIRLRINSRYLTHSSIEHLCQEFKIHLKIISINEKAKGVNKKKQIEKHKKGQKAKNYLGVPENESQHKHIFNLFEKHYFIEEKTPFSSYYIKHIDELPEDCYNKRFNKSKNKMVIDNKRKITSSNLVRSLMKSNHFKLLTYADVELLTTTFYNEIDKDLDFPLDYDEDSCTRLIAPLEHGTSSLAPIKRKIEQSTTPKSIWYADFECDVSGKIHKPFICVLQSLNGETNKEFIGEDCDKQFLDFLPDNAVVYFHNLAYDIRMIAKYGLNKSIIKGTKVMKGIIKYNEKIIHLKDTLPILSCKLSQLPQMFDIKGIQKEIFPYKYYTLDRLNTNIGVINEAGLMEDKIWTTDDYKLFNENIDKIPGCRIDADRFDKLPEEVKSKYTPSELFDMWKYVSFYCQQDVNILRIGFNAFRDGFVKDFKIDPFDFISISSLANEVFNKRVYYPNGNLFKLGGHVRKFCSRAIYGGRCMCAYNKKWHIRKPLCDFDAVSLYPSAMARLYTVEGRPKVIKPEQLNLDFLSKQSAYIVEIIITKVKKHLAFPLIVRKVGGLNLNDDNIGAQRAVDELCSEQAQRAVDELCSAAVKMTVDNITLEDLINFQKIEFKFVKGYYWDGPKDYTIQKEIRYIFNKRLQYKKEKNPLQQLYKLIMNSCYGKTIERPVEKDYKYYSEGEELDNFWCKNYDKVVEDVKINSSSIHAIKTMKPIDKHFNFSLLGIQVLSMSKRIMNEVMCLAYDIRCHIYYQDTDSFMIEKEDLPKLEMEFKKKYNRELIGENLGQFHCDFPPIKDHKEMPWSIEAYFLMKKMYVHKITDSTNEIDYVIRGKGLTLNSIIYEFQSHFHNNPMELYKHLYDGNNVIFDLTKGQPMMKMNKDFTVSTNKAFNRKINVKYEEGKREDYFDLSNDGTKFEPFDLSNDGM